MTFKNPRHVTLAILVIIVGLVGCAVQRGIYHRVDEGQTLWRISQAYGVDLDLILRANDIHNARQVEAGTRIIIPGADSVRDVPPARRVASSGPSADRSKEGRTNSTASDEEETTETTTESSSPVDPGSDKAPKQTGNFQPVWPCEGQIVSRFDKEGDPTKQGIMMHVPPGSPVKAMESGTIRLARSVEEPPELQEFGNLVMIFHNDNFVSVYAHLDQVNVSKGDSVKRGQKLGTAGSSGYVEQPSCYFQIRYKVKPRDPLLFLGEPA